jgi:hypothetical protein
MRVLDMTTTKGQDSYSPIAKIPSEILLAIFRQSALRHDSNYLLSTRMRLTLTAVCHSWRELARNDPSLWASISCVEPSSLVEMCWVLSHENLLSIDLFDSPDFECSGPAIWSKAAAGCKYLFQRNINHRIEHIQAHEPQAYSFYTDGFEYEAFMNIMKELRPNCNYLECLFHTADDDQMIGDEGERFSLYSPSTSHSLQSLSVSELSLAINCLNRWPLRVLHLSNTRYDLSPLQVEQYISVLNHLGPYLEDLSLAIPKLTFTESLLKGIIHAPKLTRLILDFNSDQVALNFLNSISLTSSMAVKIELITWPSNRHVEFWSSVALFLNEQYKGRETLLFRVENMKNAFVFESIDGLTSFVLSKSMRGCRNNGAWTQWGALPVLRMREFVEALHVTLKERVVDLHIYEEFDHYLSNRKMRRMCLPWAVLATSFHNVHVLTIATGPYHHPGKIWGTKPWTPMMPVIDPDAYHDTFIPRNIHSTLLTMLAYDSEMSYFPALRALRFKGHRLQRVTHYDGETQLLAFLQNRFTCSNPIAIITLDNDCTMSSLFRHAISYVSPTTVVDINNIRQIRFVSMSHI